MKIHLVGLSFFLLVFLFINNESKAQGDQKIEIEKVTEKCEGLPFEDKVRIAVADFQIATPEVPSNQFGSELAVMLTNALGEINCFRVLEKISVMQSSEVAKEKNLSQIGTVDNYLPANDPQMLKSQAVITGDITEFSSTSGKSSVLGVGVSKPKVMFGFILKVIDPRTRELLWSKSIETETKKGGGFSGVQLFGSVNIAGGNKYNKAEADVIERGIIKAMYLLAEDREKIRFPEADNSATVTVAVQGVNFSKLRKLISALQTDDQLKSVSNNGLNGGNGSILIKHELTFDEVLNIVADKGDGQVEVLGFDPGRNIIDVQVINE